MLYVFLVELSRSNLVFHQLDIADKDSIAAFADWATKQFGRVDILVNNAGMVCTVCSADCADGSCCLLLFGFCIQVASAISTARYVTNFFYQVLTVSLMYTVRISLCAYLWFEMH